MIAAAILLAACSSGTDDPTVSAPAVSSGSSVLPGSAAAPFGSPGGPGSPGSPAAGPDWPTYAHDPARSGVATGTPTPTSVQVGARVALDGAVYAAPVIANGTVVAATENDTVYALGADGTQRWRTHLGSPAQQAELPCGNVFPLGITGTPVVQDRTVYVAAEYGGPPRHELVALDLATGAVKWRTSIDLGGVDARAMQQRGALAIAGGRVWVPFGGLAGDCGDYLGRVVGVPLGGSGGPLAWTVPTTRQGGIWTPPGPSVDADGNLYVAVGNGESTGGRYDGSDSVVKIDPGTAQRIGFFAPTSWASDNATDADLGSQGPALVGPWVFIAGKSGTGYVLRRASLGGVGGQVSSSEVCESFGGTAVDGSTVYVPCTDGVRAVAIDGAGRVTVRWHADSSITGAPVVAGGRVWSLDTDQGVLHVLDPSNGTSLLTVDVGPVTRFASLAVSGRLLAVPTSSGITLATVG